MKVVFTHGYFLNEDPKEKRIMRPYPPLGILYLSAWLEKHGVDNEVFDSTFSDKASLYQYLLSEVPDVIAIYTNLMTKLNVIELMRFIKQNSVFKKSVIVLGGPDVTYNVDNYLDAGANVIVIGEGEQTMLEIVRSVENGIDQEFGHITGLAYRNAEGDVIKTAARSRIRPVDQLPWPNRKKIDLHLYLNAWKFRHGQSALSVSTQRGCPYTCRWCSTAVYGQSYRRRSPENVVAEMKHIAEVYNPDSIWFVDDVFTVSHKWIDGFLAELDRQNVRIPFECITRADRLNDEVITTLKKAGCFRVWIGAESGSQRIIDAMDRRVEVGQVRRMIRAARSSGIQAGTFIMLGYPGETEADIFETAHHLKTSNPDLFTITIAYPIKGTGLYSEVESKRLENLNWEESTDRDIDFVRHYPRRYYDFAVRWVVNTVNYHKLVLDRKQWSFTGLKIFLKTVAARSGMIWFRTFGKTQKPV